MPPKNNIYKQKQSAVQCSEDCYHCEMTQNNMRWSGSYLNLFTPANDICYIFTPNHNICNQGAEKVKMLVLQLYEVQDFHKYWVKNLNSKYYLHISCLE